MLKLTFVSFFILFGAFAQDAFFECKGISSPSIAKVFVDSKIFCANERINPAHLIIAQDEETIIYNGSLLRWKSSKGETFIHKKDKGEVSFHLPYGSSVGILAKLEDGQVVSSEEFKCVTKQIEPNCN